MDRRTDRRTYQWTDKPGYVDARTHLKTKTAKARQTRQDGQSDTGEERKQSKQRDTNRETKRDKETDRHTEGETERLTPKRQKPRKTRTKTDKD